MATNLQFSPQQEGVVAIKGELTRNSLIDERLLNQQLQSTQSVLYFDLSEVSRVDTAGLAWLIHSLGLLQRQG